MLYWKVEGTIGRAYHLKLQNSGRRINHKNIEATKTLEPPDSISTSRWSRVRLALISAVGASKALPALAVLCMLQCPCRGHFEPLTDSNTLHGSLTGAFRTHGQRPDTFHQHQLTDRKRKCLRRALLSRPRALFGLLQAGTSPGAQQAHSSDREHGIEVRALRSFAFDCLQLNTYDPLCLCIKSISPDDPNRDRSAAQGWQLSQRRSMVHLPEVVP